MNTEMTLSKKCDSLEDTLMLGELLGRACRGGEVFELISDLGGGKTSLVHGMARAFGVEDQVTSPTFSINNTYMSDSLTLQHFDFFRLTKSGVVGEELKEYLGDKDSIVVIEWGEIVHDILPIDRVTIHIWTTDVEKRLFEIKYPIQLEYLVEGLMA